MTHNNILNLTGDKLKRLGQRHEESQKPEAPLNRPQSGALVENVAQGMGAAMISPDLRAKLVSSVKRRRISNFRLLRVG
tara:strand:- start:318 stop:554 length:237 start_codon:yes stop_codon:yes gene_type:complete